MDEYQEWLKWDKTKREILYRMREPINNLKEGFVFLRMKALKSLKKFLKTMNEDDVPIFATIQDSAEENQLVRLLFQYILNPTPSVATSPYYTPVTVEEKALGLELLQGLLLLHPACKDDLAINNGMQLITDIMSSSGSQQQLRMAALEVILAALVDSRANQEYFINFNDHAGIRSVIKLLCDKSETLDLRCKCIEILVFYLNYFQMAGIEAEDDDNELRRRTQTEESPYKQILAELLGAPTVEILLSMKANMETNAEGLPSLSLDLGIEAAALLERLPL